MTGPNEFSSYQRYYLLQSPRDLLESAGEGLTLMVNSLFNGWRMEDVWLDQ